MSPSRAAESFRKRLEEGLTGLGPWARCSKKEEVHLQGFKKLPAGISLGVGQEVLAASNFLQQPRVHVRLQPCNLVSPKRAENDPREPAEHARQGYANNKIRVHLSSQF
jgi:hypothetical protein